MTYTVEEPCNNSYQNAHRPAATMMIAPWEFGHWMTEPLVFWFAEA